MRLVVCAVTVLALACAQDPPAGEQNASPIEAAASQEIRLAIGDTVVIQGTDARITARAVERDSRCPSAVQCIRAGNAAVGFVVRRESQDTAFTLNTTSGTRTASLPGLIVDLVGLAPYPERPRPPIAESEYRVDLVVSILPRLTGIPLRPERLARSN